MGDHPRPEDQPAWRIGKVSAIACVAFLALMGFSYLVAAQWYADDECPRADWQCDAGVLGIYAFVAMIPLAAVSALVAIVAFILAERSSRRAG